MAKSLFVALTMSLMFSGVTSAQTTIEAGFDLFVTRPIQTFIDLNDLLPICPDAANSVRV